MIGQGHGYAMFDRIDRYGVGHIEQHGAAAFECQDIAI